MSNRQHPGARHRRGSRSPPVACVCPNRIETLEQRRLLSAPLAPELVDQHVVRIAYLIPTNRQPQEHAVGTLRTAMRWWHAWYGEQMWRNGFGAKTFVYETEADGVTPKVNVASLPRTDDYYRDDENGGANTLSRVLMDTESAGIGINNQGQVWLLVFEAHKMHPDGRLTGGQAQGNGWGAGSAPGWGIVGSDTLALIRPEFLADDRPYDGLIIPDLGPYPMVQDVSCQWFLGNTLSSVASSYIGTYLHEFSHGFGALHDFRDDVNFHGNLMANGLRGIRGNLYPARYPQDQMRLGYATAMELNTSRYFNGPRTYSDEVLPVVSAVTASAPEQGLLRIDYTASDDTGLASALLYMGDIVVGEMSLSGTSAAAHFLTPWYFPGEERWFRVEAYDVEGNRASGGVSYTPPVGLNRAPWPLVKLSRYTPMVGQDVTLDASLSLDHDDPASSLRFQWDLDGDGTFDTPLSSLSTYTTSFDGVGVPRRVRVRVVDPHGAGALSTPIGIRVVPPDTTAPAVTASAFAFATAPHRLGFTFSEDVWGSFGLEDVLVENLTTGATIPVSDMRLTLGPDRDATITFPGFTRGVLPDGRYRATLAAAGVRDGAGNAMASDHAYEFFFLTGDANHDARVTLADFNILASNFGQSPRDFTRGDFNYDGVVNLSDFNLLAARFGAGVARAQALASRGPLAQRPWDELISTMESDELADALR